MQRMLRRLVMSCLLLAALPAVAAIGPNGLGPNGLGPNGLGPNGLGPNGLGPNGLGPNGLGPNGLGPNGLGPNGLGPNGLGPNGLNLNGLDVNGLGPNGLGPNGLGPNGLPFDVLTIEPNGLQPASEFKAWFEADTASRSQYMKYFSRCSYDGSTVIAYLDSTGKTWAWTGQYGLAMTSAKTVVYDAAGTAIGRARMTADESEWVSACILAHVNVQGTHQYISLRGNPPNAEAQAALRPSPGELWAMRPASIYFGNLFDGTRDPTGALIPDAGNQLAALNTGEGGMTSPVLWSRFVILGVLNTALGRTCDAESCGPYLNAEGLTRFVINNTYTVKELVRPSTGLTGTYLADQAASSSARGELGLVGSQTDPVHAFDSVVRYGMSAWTPGELPHRPLFVGMPAFDLFQPGPPTSPMEMPTKSITSVGAVPIDATQYVAPSGSGLGQVLVGLTAGQVLEQVRTVPGGLALASPATPIDMNESFTAIVRYANPKATPAAARVEVSDDAGGMRDAGTEIWPVTGTAADHEWLQVYPVRLYLDASGTPTLKVRFSGAANGEACSGAKVMKGDGETGTCAIRSIYFDWKHLKVMCRESGESKPVCRGDLVFDYRAGKWGWFCDFGGKALFACTAADAPQLETAAIVPGRPWCAGADATAFAGVCK